MSEHDDETLLEFPCDFPIKAMGKAGIDLESTVVTIIRRHAPDLGEGAVRVRESRGGNYLSITVTVRATSREQLDDIYRDLTACEQVVMAL